MKHKVVVGTGYGGLALTLECVKWLKDHGYSEEMVKNIYKIKFLVTIQLLLDVSKK